MADTLVVLFLICMAWIVIPTLLFFTLFFLVWIVFKLTANPVYFPRYASVLKWSPLRGVWFGMSSFMEERAFTQLEQGLLKRFLKLIYPLFILWDKTFLIFVFLMMALGGLIMFGLPE